MSQTSTLQAHLESISDSKAVGLLQNLTNQIEECKGRLHVAEETIISHTQTIADQALLIVTLANRIVALETSNSGS